MFTKEFLDEFQILMKDEGNYSNDSNDSGGETKFGFARKFNMDISEEDWKNFSIDDAKERFYTKWWKKYRIQEIKNNLVRHKLINIGFMTGMTPVIECLQKALKQLGVNVDVDGIIGNQTISAVNNYRNKFALNEVLESQITQYLLSLKKKDRFINGWLSRVDRDYNT